jgi:hypothetical protein
MGRLLKRFAKIAKIAKNAKSSEPHPTRQHTRELVGIWGLALADPARNFNEDSAFGAGRAWGHLTGQERVVP